MPVTSQYPRVSLFKSRTLMYKLGLLGLICSFLLFIAGFSSSYWMSFHIEVETEDEKLLHDVNDDYGSHHSGLWNAPCSVSDASCRTSILVAQLAFCFHLAGYLICFMVATYENCRKVDPRSYHSVILELCVFVTGLLGTAGVAVFVAWYITNFPASGFKWSLTVTTVSVMTVSMTFFLLLYGNRKQFRVSSSGTMLLPQQGGVSYYNPGNPCGVTIVTNPGSMHQQQFHPQQNQPLLSQILPPCPHPAAHQQLGAPPTYTLPPAYPLPPLQPQSLVYPYYPGYVHDSHPQASAPPYDMLPEKN